MSQDIATGHPDWCAGGHQCTAEMPAGEHASDPEVWRTEHGRVVATRHRNRRGNSVEIRFVVRLPDSEHQAQRLIRHLIAAGYLMLSRVLARR